MRDHRIGAAVRVRCYLRDIRGRRGIRALAEAAGVPRATLSTIETGRSLPKDEWIDAMEAAYGAPFEDWYPALTRRSLELDEEQAAPDGHARQSRRARHTRGRDCVIRTEFDNPAEPYTFDALVKHAIRATHPDRGGDADELRAKELIEA